MQTHLELMAGQKKGCPEFQVSPFFHFILLKTHFVGAGTIAAWYRYIQQPQIHAQLGTVMDNLAEGHPDYFGLAGGAENFVAFAEGPGLFQGFFGGLV